MSEYIVSIKSAVKVIERTFGSVKANLAPVRYDILPPVSTSASAASIAIRLFATRFSSGGKAVQVSGKSGRTKQTKMPTAMVILGITRLSQRVRVKLHPL